MIDETLLATHARIQHAAFEAAYMETPEPDPASRAFAALVFMHAERLWAEHRVGRQERTQISLMASRQHATGQPHADGLIS